LEIDETSKEDSKKESHGKKKSQVKKPFISSQSGTKERGKSLESWTLNQQKRCEGGLKEGKRRVEEKSLKERTKVNLEGS